MKGYMCINIGNYIYRGMTDLSSLSATYDESIYILNLETFKVEQLLAGDVLILYLFGIDFVNIVFNGSTIKVNAFSIRDLSQRFSIYDNKIQFIFFDNETRIMLGKNLYVIKEDNGYIKINGNIIGGLTDGDLLSFSVHYPFIFNNMLLLRCNVFYAISMGFRSFMLSLLFDIKDDSYIGSYAMEEGKSLAIYTSFSDSHIMSKFLLSGIIDSLINKY